MANRVDYEQLQQAKVNSEKKFDEMLQNLETMKNDIVSMNESSWKGYSGTAFNDVFNEIKTKITQEREAFSHEIDQKLTIWNNEFKAAEEQQAKAAQNM